MHAVLKNQYLVHEILKHLHQEQKSTSTAFLPLLISNNLKVARIINRCQYGAKVTWGYDVALFMCQLQTSAIQLECFNTNIPLPPSPLNDITLFTHLRELCITFIELAVITHPDMEQLSQLENLAVLELSARQFEFYPDSSPLSFPHLQKLSITCKLEDAIKLLSLTTFPMLSSLTHQFMAPSQTSAAHWVPFFQALQTSIPSHTLKELYLLPSRSIHSTLAAPAYSTNMNQGTPFAEFSEYITSFNLTTLSLTFPLIRSLSMGDLRQMIQAWPNLTVLQLQTATSSTVKTAALPLIARKLPKLMTLMLDVDASVIVKPDERVSRLNHALERFEIRPVRLGAGVEQVASCAILVDGCFPRLEVFWDVGTRGRYWNCEYGYDCGRGNGNGRGGYDERGSRSALEAVVRSLKQARGFEKGRSESGGAGDAGDGDEVRMVMVEVRMRVRLGSRRVL
ncbi:hypothetical protein CVT24_007925 [Panaeolus cyanescens]|uniref:F-box domain-containing protein n=1 Tax=Panaeolus cyanescens TaxID=181874 RepID=A0A409WWL3_9AGAR|nr:hypothetical protein CVT24_007925 [Panaeolus cyanescens]